MPPARHRALVLAREEVAQGLHLLRAQASKLAEQGRPGQFAMVRSGGNDVFLRRPMALHGVRPGEGEVSFLFRVVGKGTAVLARLEPGQELDLLGPLGQEVKVEEDVGHLGLVAGGVGIASLTALMDEAVARGIRVTLLAGARTGWQLYPNSLLPDGVVEMTATDDGSAGVRAPVTHLVPTVDSVVDAFVACGPPGMLRSLWRLRREGAITKPVTLLLEERMGCGFGGCYGCAVATRQGIRLVCTDGPTFPMDDLLWDDPLGPAAHV
ncbi:MAG: dihydroorotate dehydrogenase electron transfer subunit [Chloroflexi bacterium]|nr:dihydroorotate dehydrogenase electron transfer subunit [Chloroflexota bacterium]